MADVASLTEIKTYLRIDGEEEDLLLASLLAAAVAHCEDYLNASLPPEVPTPVKQAVLLLVSHFYAQRIGESIPAVIYSLLAPYRNITW